MDNEYVVAEDVVDEYFAEMYSEDADDAYDKWCDDECESLDISLKQLFNDFVNPLKYGYYKGRPEKFLEHCIESLMNISDCDVKVFDNVCAMRRTEVIGKTLEV